MNQGASRAPADAAVKSAVRTIDIVEHVARASFPPTAQQIASSLEIPASSLSYLLATLVARGWLRPEGRRGYAVGATLAAVLAPLELSLVERAGAIVRDVRIQLNETCGFYEARGSDLVALVSELGSQALNYAMQVGERGPLHAFAAGKALLAARPEPAWRAYAEAGVLRRYTADTLCEGEALLADLRLTRERGFALAVGEHTPGLVSVAVAVRAGEGAISVAIPSVRFSPEVQARVVDLLHAAAARLD